MATNELKFGSKVVFLNGAALTLPMATSDPVLAVTGDLYYNSASNTVRYYNGTSWVVVSAGGNTGTIWKAAVRAVSTANINLASMPASVDGVTLNLGDRFLAKDQVLTFDNGIYVFNGTGNVATRATDAATAVDLNGALVPALSEGVVNSNTQWFESANVAVLGTDAVIFRSAWVVGPTIATDNALVRFDGTTGRLVQNSGVTVDDSGNITATNLSGTNTGDAPPLWIKYTATFTDLSAAATTNSIVLFSLPAKTMIHQVIIKHSVAFSGGAITAYTVAVGDAGNLNRYTVPFDVFQAVGDTTRSITQVNDLESFTNATNILLTAASIGANLDAATAGSVDIWVMATLLP